MSKKPQKSKVDSTQHRTDNIHIGDVMVGDITFCFFMVSDLSPLTQWTKCNDLYLSHIKETIYTYVA